MPRIETLRPQDAQRELVDGGIGTPDEEWANGLTHALGWLLSMVGSAALLHAVVQRGTTWQLMGCLVYCISLIAVYAASTLSHWVTSPLWRSGFRAWDQGLIYLLIAGNFTPFAVACFQGWWYLLSILMWTLALVGFISKVAFRHRINGISVRLYLVLGWLMVLGSPQLIAAGHYDSFQLAVVGGGTVG